jgi:hypothetical protein
MRRSSISDATSRTDASGLTETTSFTMMSAAFMAASLVCGPAGVLILVKPAPMRVPAP